MGILVLFFFLCVGEDHLDFGIGVVGGEGGLDVGEVVAGGEGVDGGEDEGLMVLRNDVGEEEGAVLDKVGKVVLDGAYGEGTLGGDVLEGLALLEEAEGFGTGVDFGFLGGWGGSDKNVGERGLGGGFF